MPQKQMHPDFFQYNCLGGLTACKTSIEFDCIIHGKDVGNLTARDELSAHLLEISQPDRASIPESAVIIRAIEKSYGKELKNISEFPEEVRRIALEMQKWRQLPDEKLAELRDFSVELSRAIAEYEIRTFRGYIA